MNVLARQACSIETPMLHGSGATSIPGSCTVPVQHGVREHARLGVQHHAAGSCTASVQQILHGSGATPKNITTRTKPVMHWRARRTKNLYRNLTTGLRKSGTNPQPTDRARGNEVGHA